MPLALIWTIRPRAAARVPANLSRAAHAAILRLVDAADAELAARVHDDEGPKPLTVSNILGLNPRGREALVRPDLDYGLRVTLLNPALEALAAAWHAAAVSPLDLDGLLWDVTAVTADPAAHPWAGYASYEDLAAPALLRAAGSPARWTFEFAAPVTFRQRGLNQPLPTADLTFGSLLDKWNAFAPLALPEEVRRFAAECIAVSRFDLASRAEPTKGGVPQVGAVGQVTYVAVHRDRYWLACIDTLARFAFYSGVGAGAARGFGRARLVDG